jgi:hypothetical protein
VNGDPVTGTQGSIPPAKAFDEDQIEIVNVIANAGLTPNHTELDQLWQALQALFAQKYITTPITKTVHGVGADFTDLNAAFVWLANYIITPTGSVTFMVAPGKWTYATTVEVNHPNANRVTIQGGALLGATPQYQNFSTTGYHTGTDGTNHITYLRSVHATELAFTGGVTGFVTTTRGVTLRYLLVSGSQTIATGPTNFYGISYQGNGLLAYEDVNLDGCSFWGFGSVGIQIIGATVSQVSGLSIVSSFNGWQGMTMNGGIFFGSINAQVILMSNGVAGLTNFGGMFWADRVVVKGHGPPLGNAAIQCEQGGQIFIGVIGGGANHGLICEVNQTGVILSGALMIAEGASYSNNATYGIWLHGGATAYVTDSQFFTNGVNAILAQENSYANAVRSAFTGTGDSPPNNTTGNIESYIQV